MNHRFLVVPFLVLLPAAGLAGGGIDLHERVVLDADGSAGVTLEVIVRDRGGRELVLPFDHPLPDRIACADTSLQPTLREENGARFVVIPVTAQTDSTVVVTCHIPAYAVWDGMRQGDFGNVTLTHRFRNTSGTRVLSYQGDLLLPPGMAVTSVESSIPVQTEKDPVTPFDILRQGDRSGVSIRGIGLALGDVASVTIRCKSAGKSPVLFGALVAAAFFYLVVFRDVLKDNGNGSSPAENPQA
jgi:hypothetical protein